ncbi:putative oxidoreductase YgbJ [Cocos nucifera]|uniref:Putative oxidoreductase YgbJ n=1 Tax=Cocos nucifera TaxID=13894 RepID=A0A8K0IGN8_COCNU|nr:putative oxidoreductase YgbJ [Cocos nucifera]
MAYSNVVGFVGLDELSLELASSLIRSGFRVQGFEVVGSSVMDRFVELGGAKCGSPMEATRNATAMIVVASADEMTEVFFGKEGVVRDEAGHLVLVDAQIFQGVSEPLKGKNIVITSGSQIAMQRAQPVLSAISEKVFSFEGEVSVGRKIRMVNDLLEGIHLVASVEAIFLGVRAGIHPSILYDIISNAAGSSW